MKKIVCFALFAAMAMSQLAWADAGPFYVSIAGYCDVKAVYVNANNDLYGTEVGCTGTSGNPIIGHLNADGSADTSELISTTLTSSKGMCLGYYATNGTQRYGCSIGGAFSYTSSIAGYKVRHTADGNKAAVPNSFSVSTEMPDTSTTKDLPSLAAQ